MKINRSAFGLVEVLVSSLIMAVLFGSFFAFFGNMQGLIRAEQNKAHALFFAQNQLEMLMDENYGNNALNAGAHTNTLPDTIAGVDCRMKTLLSGTRTYSVTDSLDGGYKLVDVTIAWRYRGKDEKFELSTIIVK